MEHKVLEIKEAVVEPSGDDAAQSGPGVFKGYGSVFNSVDRVNDRIIEGAYKDTIPTFLKDGFIGWGHDWNDPVATIDTAEERAKGLWIEATFHTHAEAQRARGIVKERLDRGKSMGLSIGYAPVEWKWVKDEGQEYETREITKIDLFEVSLVTVPAEPKARVTSIKGLDGLRAGGADLAVEEWKSILTELKEGRVLSSRNAARLKEATGKMREIVDSIEALLAEAGGEEDTPKGGEGLAAWAEFIQTQMRLSGVR
jgi:HK97 family phage prohead protease